VIVGVAYNTSDYGATPQRPQPCNSTPQGCPYDALNVGLAEPEKLLTVGADPTEEVYVDSKSPTVYCEKGTTGTFGPAKCASYWEGAQPVFTVKAS
jgi:hypothetical protein